MPPAPFIWPVAIPAYPPFLHPIKNSPIGNEDVLYFSWASIHNYNINHPPTYPFDEVNLTGRLLTEDEITRYNLSPEEVAEINLNRTVAGILRRRPLNTDDAARLNLSRGEIEAINQKYENG